jgi:hypothetical protein
MPSRSGDDLLDAFNDANTSSDFAGAQEAAAKIAAEPSTPRRRVALALASYNREDYKLAREWAEAALTGDLPGPSRETATLVLGRALINLDHPRMAIQVLRKVAAHTPTIGWLLPAAMADAYVQLGNNDAAMREAGRALEAADDVPEARFHIARTAWHAGRVWDALDHVSRYRVMVPGSLPGLLLHASILGYLGTQREDREAFESALRLLQVAATDTDNCEAIRLSALTAAKLGRWRDAFRWSSRLIRRTRRACKHPGGADAHRHDIETYIVPSAFEALGERNPVALEQAADEAERRFGRLAFLDSQRALARALKGDIAGSLAALGRTVETLADAPSTDQVIIAAAFYGRAEYAKAFGILRRVEHDLTRPVGMLRYLECAIAADKLDDARRVVGLIAEGDDAAADVARLAHGLLQAFDRKAARGLLVTVAEADLRWFPHSPTGEMPSPRQSPWEGRHHRTTPLLDGLTRPLVH